MVGAGGKSHCLASPILRRTASPRNRLEALPYIVARQAKYCYDIVTSACHHAGKLPVVESHRHCQLNKASW